MTQQPSRKFDTTIVGAHRPGDDMTPAQMLAVRRQLMAYILRFRRGWLWAALVMFISTLASSLVLLLIRTLIDEAIPLAEAEATRTAGWRMIWETLILMIALTIFSTVVMRQIRARIARLAQDMMVLIRADYYESLANKGLDFYRRHDIGELTAIVAGDAEVISVFFTQQVPLLMINLGQFILAFLFMLLLSWQLTAISVILVVALQWLSLVLIVPRVRRQVALYREGLGSFSGRITEYLSGIRDIQVYSQERRTTEQIRAQLNDLSDRNVASVSLTASNVAIFYALNGLGLALIYGTGALGVSSGFFAVGALVSFAGFFVQFISPITTFSNALVSVQSTMVAAERIFELMRETTGVIDRPDGLDPGRLRGHVRFENVTFRYDKANRESWEIHGVNLDIQPGEKVAFVGGSGTGKSTLLDLVTRFHEVTYGRVTIDGYDVRDLKLAALRRNVGMISQDVRVFSGTLRENITFGRPEASDQEIRVVANLSQLASFIDGLPEGLDTKVGEEGQGLSGGQRQRISIARALLTDPAVLIMDEATSALDVETERRVSRRLDKALTGRTTLIITHRLATVLNADKIVLLGLDETGRGVVKAVGTHDELLAKSEDYALFYDRHSRRKGVLMPIGPNYNTTPVLATVVGIARAENAPVYLLDFGTVSEADKIFGRRFDMTLPSQRTTIIQKLNLAHEHRVVAVLKLLMAEGVRAELVPAGDHASWSEAMIAAVEATEVSHVVALDDQRVPLAKLRENIQQIERQTAVEYILVDTLDNDLPV